MVVISLSQAPNHEFFRAGEFSWNQDTSINNYLQPEMGRPHREKSTFLSL